jgi:HSP20 family protein
MAITDLIPWKREKNQLQIRREDDSVLALRDQIDQLFDEFFEKPFGLRLFDDRFDALAKFSPSIDVSETEKEIRVVAELPGMEVEDIEIELHDDYLTIRGEKKSEKEEKSERFYRSERSYGSFHRTISLPTEINPEKVNAKFKNGVLNIALSKTSTGKSSKRIEIK